MCVFFGYVSVFVAAILLVWVLWTHRGNVWASCVVAKAREPAVKALIAMFYNYEELARNEEKKTDAILEGENAEKPPTNAPQKVHEDFIEETISQCE